jgi:hypothetical protein
MRGMPRRACGRISSEWPRRIRSRNLRRLPRCPLGLRLDAAGKRQLALPSVPRNSRFSQRLRDRFSHGTLPPRRPCGHGGKPLFELPHAPTRTDDAARWHARSHTLHCASLVYTRSGGGGYCSRPPEFVRRSHGLPRPRSTRQRTTPRCKRLGAGGIAHTIVRTVRRHSCPLRSQTNSGTWPK